MPVRDEDRAAAQAAALERGKELVGQPARVDDDRVRRAFARADEVAVRADRPEREAFDDAPSLRAQRDFGFARRFWYDR